jgi:hypothetical protein
METVAAELGVAVPPFRGAPTRDAHGLGHVGDRRTGLDAPAEQESSLRGEWSITVRQEDLRGSVLASSPAHLLPEVSSWVDPYRVTNVHERNT